MSTATSQPTKVITGKVRLSYVNVFEPRAMKEGQEPKFSVVLLISKTDTKQIGEINKAILAAFNKGREKGKHKFTDIAKLPQNFRLPLHDGDIEKPDRPEYENMYFITASASADRRPQVVDANVKPIIDRAELYSGCYGRASINFFPYNSGGGIGIGCGLNNLQKLEDGERLSGGATAQDDFGAAPGADILG